MRYAIYFAPGRGSSLASAGARWLGRDAFSGTALSQPALPGLSADRFAALTADPRRYGFHATLKAPFELADGYTEGEVASTIAAFARERRAFGLRLALTRLDGFLALTPAEASAGVDALAADAVRVFDRFRAPPGPGEIERRRRAGLTPAEDDNLVTWGYPYVFESFRFHMTLSQRLQDADAELIEAAARSFFGDLLSAPVPIDRVALFAEPSPGAPFTVIASADLACRT
jgi:putative phosphonate metabolism protein